MSYILDALKRSERERRGQGPAKDPLLEGGAPAPAPLRPLWPLLLGLALLANAGVLAWYLLLREPPPPSPPQTVAPSPPPSARPAPESQPTPRQAPQPPAEPSAEAPREPPQSAPAAASPDPQPPAEPARQQPSAESAPPAAEASPRPPTAAPSSAPSTPSAPWEALPYLEQLPAGFRSSVPELTVDVHVFTDDPARRFVLVDLRRYREGDQLPGGLRLMHITPDGVALAWQDRRFRLSTR